MPLDLFTCIITMFVGCIVNEPTHKLVPIWTALVVFSLITNFAIAVDCVCLAIRGKDV